MLAISHNILQVTRAKDWRLSFVPFIIGCVYLWLWWFEIKLSVAAFSLFVLSFITTIGFASLGYFINEFFDKVTDAKAGKINMLGALPAFYQLILLLVCAVLAFLPWLWLPKDRVTFILIATELSLFLVYSLPFPRLKGIPLLSGFIDSGYAYVVPLALSFYTYSLFTNSTVPCMFYVLIGAVFFIGVRNITIHHVNDVFKDIRSSTQTLPQVLGVKRTNALVVTLLAFEVAFILVWGVLIAYNRPLFTIWIVLFLTFLFMRLKFLSSSLKLEYFSIEPVRHLTDPAYQYVFPAVCLALAITVDFRWMIFVPVHFALLLTRPMQVIAWETVYWKSIQLKYAAIRTFTKIIIVPSSLFVNYTIFMSFLVVGINLRKEKKTALMVLKEKLRCK
jgi:1,4-dihydroxy-2-naphthoate octaprenyltransferase